MEEIIKKLETIPNAYFAFIAGVNTYIKDNPDRQRRLLEFLNTSNGDLTTSDVIKFISDQPDFFDDSVFGAKNESSKKG